MELTKCLRKYSSPQIEEFLILPTSLLTGSKDLHQDSTNPNQTLGTVDDDLYYDEFDAKRRALYESADYLDL